MTPKKAAALSKRIDVMCDEPFMFACKVGSGCHASCKGKRDPQDYLTMILQLIDGVFDRLPPRQKEKFIEWFLLVLKRYLEDKRDEENQNETVQAETPQRRSDNLLHKPRAVSDDVAGTIRAICARLDGANRPE